MGHQSATDIISFSTGRRSILIGPRSAFGVQKKELLLNDAGRIRSVLDQLLLLDGNRTMIRPYVVRWGLDPNVLTRSDRSMLPRWLTGKAMTGAIGVAVVPDPVIAFSGLADMQEITINKLKNKAALKVDDDPAAMLPPDMDERFYLLMEMMPVVLKGETLRKFNDLVEKTGLETIAIGLLIWIGAHFVPGVNLVMLAFDVFALSSDVLRAIETIVKCMDDLKSARVRSDLDPIALVLGGAIGVLVTEGVLRRFAKIKKTPKGQIKSTAKVVNKPSANASSGGGRAPRTGGGARPKKKKKDKPEKAKPPKANAGRHFSPNVDEGTKRALRSFSGTKAGKVSQDLDGKSLADVKKHMATNHPGAKKTVSELKTPKGQNGKVIQTKWELDDGTVVRVKETDPIGGKVDRFRGEPAISVSALKRDAAGNPLPDSFANEAFKVAPDGTPIPKRPADVDVSGLSNADKNKRIDAVMNAGHRSITR